MFNQLINIQASPDSSEKKGVKKRNLIQVYVDMSDHADVGNNPPELRFLCLPLGVIATG
jgi:hypothetical protein